MRGERTDLNGPFLAREALRLGLEPARIAIVGDGAEELEAALREALTADACLVSGGLGPTHDDRTVELVARALGVGVHVDEALEREIDAVSRAAAQRLKRPYADFQPGRDEAGDDSRRGRLARPGRHRAGAARAARGRAPRRPAARPAVGAAAALAARARDGRVPRAADAGASAGAARPALLRRQRVRRGARARRRGRRRGRGRGDDLRARLRDPRRPRRRAGRRAPRGGARGAVLAGHREVALLARRAADRSARPRAPARARTDASRRPSRAPAGWSRRGSPAWPVRAESSSEASSRTRTR